MPNRSGGFLGAILNWYVADGIPLFMQIEQGKLCFKIGEVHSDRGDIRNRFHNLLMNNATPELQLNRPGRFGSGTYMTVAVVPGDVWLGAGNDLVDLDTVVTRLNRYETWLKRVLGKVQVGQFTKADPVNSAFMSSYLDSETRV